MKLGDIIYVIKPYKARYSDIGDYHFIPGHFYEIIFDHGHPAFKSGINNQGYVIKNITTNDCIPHFLNGEDCGYFVTSDKWRELQLEKIGICG